MKYYKVGEYDKGTLDGTCAVEGCHRVVKKVWRREEYLTLCPGHVSRYERGQKMEGRIATNKWHFQSRTVNSFIYEDGLNRDMMLIETKYDELVKYIKSRCYSWRADHSRYDDIVSNVIERLLKEDAKKPFKDARTLWGRAANVAKEEIAQTFADRLPVSGVKFQAHWTATKALQAANGDPRAAYATQTGTSRVGRELIYAVSHGPSLYSPEYLQDLELEKKREVSSVTTQDEDNIRVAMFELTQQEQQIVYKRMWMRMTNAQVGEEMGLSAERVRKLWQGALKTLKPVLEQSLSARYTD